MSTFNQATVQGIVTKAPTVRETKTAGLSIATFTLKTYDFLSDERKAANEEAGKAAPFTLHNIKYFIYDDETLERVKAIKVGMEDVRVVGQLHVDSWDMTNDEGKVLSFHGQPIRQHMTWVHVSKLTIPDVDTEELEAVDAESLVKELVGAAS